jgi:hypothetical protein
LLQAALAEPPEFEISQFWEQKDPPATYWILLISAIDQQSEMEIATTLLVWEAFFAKESVQVLCIQSSERQFFQYCSTHFSTIICPALVVSDSPEMAHFIKVESQLLYKLTDDKSQLRRFLARIHAMAEDNSTLTDINMQLETEHFWSEFDLVRSEIEGFISFGTMNDANMEGKMSSVENAVCFLSHNREDKDLVREVGSILHGFGIETWFDEWEILPGDRITEKIEEGLSKATSVIIFLSPHAVASPWVTEEMHTSLYQTISTGRLQIIPVVVTECEIPLLLSNYSRIDVGNDKTQIANEIRRAVLRITNKPPVEGKA